MTDIKSIDTSKLIEIDNTGVIEFENRIPFERLRAQHKKIYKLITSVGNAYLRRIRQTALEETVIRLMEEDPEYRTNSERGAMLYEKQRYGKEDLTEDEMTELRKIAMKLNRGAKFTAMNCIIDPVIKTEEDYDIFMGLFPADERVGVELALQELANPNIEGNISIEFATIAERMGAKPYGDIKVEEITAQQYSAEMKRTAQQENIIIGT